MTPSLSVLIPTHGRGEKLRALLERLRAQTLAPERFEVIVVDDGSPEPVRLDPPSYPFALELVRQAQAGPGAARNRGLERCTAPLVLILNDDALPASDLCERHLAAQAEVGERCAVLGTFHFTEAARQSPFVRVLDESDLLFSFAGLEHGRIYPWTHFWTCNLCLPVAALRAVGGFDAERFPEAIVEDVELGYRLAQQGWRVAYRADCRAEHDHAFTPSEYLRRSVKLGRYLWRMWQKHRDPRVLWQPDEAALQRALGRAVTVVEHYGRALAGLEKALERLDAEYRDRPLSAALAEQTVQLVQEIALAPFYRGVHLEATGVDALEVIERGAPSGRLTSVVLVSCNAQGHTRRAIEALRAAREAEHPLELVVVDNGSSDGSTEWLAQQTDLVLVCNAKNHGAPRARNQALAHCRGEWVAFLDNDVFVPRGWLGRALYHGAVDPGVGAIALVANRASKHQQVPYTGGSDAASIERAAEARFAEHARTGLDGELFTSLAVLVKREVLERIGGFDEAFSPWGFEDDDLALRVRAAGWRNRVALDTFVYHAPYPDMEKHRRHARWLHDNWERFAVKWGPGGTTPPLFDYAALELDPARSLSFHVPLPAEGAPPPTWRADEATPAVPAAPAAPAPTAGGPHSVLVLGAGRSGTSLVAGTLARAGWYAGDDPYPGREANPKGFFETAEINGLNEYLLAIAEGGQRSLGPMQRWLEVRGGPIAPDVPIHALERMRRLVRRTPFAFKDPRFCYTLPAWRAVAGNARFVCVFREPAATAASIARECAEAEYLRGVEMSFERALEVWCAMYRSALAERHRGGEWLFVHYDQLLTTAGLERLEQFVGAPVDRAFPDGQLSRSRRADQALVPSARAVGPAAEALYRELCALAGHAVPPAAVAPAPAPARPAACPELTVLICTYQRLATLQRCLASFEQQTARGRYEIVVVNDGSTDGTREWLEAWEPALAARVVQRSNGGLSAARNSGLEVARGGLVLLVNDDTIAHPELVERHLAAHAAHGPRLAVLGTFDQPPAALDNALMRVLEDDTLVFCYAQLRAGERHDWNRFWTCNVSVGLADVRAVGGFDESFRHYGCEDTDLAYRLSAELGTEVLYDPTARATHEHVLTFDDLQRRNRTVARAFVRLFHKHPGALRHEFWRRFASCTRAGLEAELVAALPRRAGLEATARELARLDFGVLERSGRRSAELAKRTAEVLRAELRALNELWWAEGLLEGLEEFGADSFAALVADRRAAPAGAAHASTPWPLATTARTRYLAWPRYGADTGSDGGNGGDGDLERLLATWGEALLDDPERCLCLRHDPMLDGELDAAVERLGQAYARVVPEGRSLEVLLVDGEIPQADLLRLGRAVQGVLAFPGADPARDAWLERLGAEVLRDPARLAPAAIAG